MRIESADFVRSFSQVRDIKLEAKPSIAFIGRSNVGKSSLINSLLNRNKLVKTSSTPGKTQLINYFLINRSFYFIDLPGYGFTKAPIAVKSQWQILIKEFLSFCPNLKLIVQLVDIRHKPSAEDEEFQAIVHALGIPCLVVANKVDKLKKSQITKSIKEIKQTLHLSQEPIAHSALHRVGQSEIWQQLKPILE